ncbi:ankyrin repeat domain-containing protein [Undibacterium sp.]|jgi:ankyrin repeat protein|uniref:ankyrin repeat domain-containing protein n=1 Tax=Undibacterium sp. TaxID=1914977 RepID=UPI002BCD8529|nr:ankyrin repeat domain-containing protein [Undibacterium sp.]HTD05169.1 ankyrin repeat domain-containing protein [Undibacterium sp.]
MSGEKSRMLWRARIAGVVLLALLLGWCTTHRRAQQALAPMKAELYNLFYENGLTDNSYQDISDVARKIGPERMDRLLYDAAPSISLAAMKWMVAHGADPKNIGVMKDMSLLQRAARLPQYDRMVYLLSFGLNPTERTSDGRTLLHIAAAGDLDERTLSLFASKGLKIDDVDLLGRQPIHYASPKSIPALVAAGANISAVDSSGRTALHQAAKEGRNDAVVALLAGGASVYDKDKSGKTPLHLAAKARDTDAVIETLLAAGAPITARDDDGNTPKDLSEDTSRYGTRRPSVRDRL